jgi:ABC-type transport system involved in multi-copper enzyme maturation permease subunit
VTIPPPLPSRRSPGHGNALLGWELLRVSRKIGALAVGRFTFGAALLGVMWLIWSAGYADKEFLAGDVNEIAKELNRFAGDFSLTFFIVQLTIVLLLTPIFVAGSVFEERETRSGEVLLTTDLTRREVFYGKFLARVVQVMMVVAAGMPILALTLLWGGVAIHFVVIGYIATFCCIFSSGAIAASVAGGSETLREAILKAYGYILVFDGLILPASPFLLVPFAQEQLGPALCVGVIFVAVQLLVTILSLGYGLRWLRLAMLRQRRRVTADLAAQMARRKPPLAEEDPLVWKERYVAGENEIVATMSFMMSALAVGVVAIFALVAPFPTGWVAVGVVPAALAAAAVLVGLGAAGAIARERQKNTLGDLFMLPDGRTEILRAKLQGAIWRGRSPLAAIGALLLLAIPAGTPLAAVPLLALAAVAFLLFAAALGIWLSVRCRTALNANAAWMGFVALSLIGTYLIADASAVRVPIPNTASSRAGQQFRKEYPAWSRVVNPVLAWQELAMTPEETGIPTAVRFPWRLRVLPDRPPRDLVPAAGGVVLYGAAAGALGLLARRRFEREGREE